MTDEFQLQRPDPQRLKPVDLDELLSTGEVGKIFGVSSNTVLNWIKEGKIEATQTPGKHARISRRSVMAYGKSTYGGNADPTIADWI